MSPALLATIISLVEQAIKDAPGILAEFQGIFNKPNPTPEDWQAMRVAILAKSYKDFVPDSALPDNPPTPPPPTS